jgi:AcrR family transcriptional regulator
MSRRMSGTGRPARLVRRRGRPPGATEQGRKTRARLYRTAIDRFVRVGYQATTLRQIATRAKVSVGLLYRYFPSKRAVVLELYHVLSAAYAERAAAMPEGPWCGRFLFALRTSLEVLAPHRRALAALLPVLLGDAEDNPLAASAAPSRLRVQRVFAGAVEGASDVPPAGLAGALGRLLYVGHLAVLLWWLFDRSPRQQATRELVARIEALLPAAGFVLALPTAGQHLAAFDAQLRQALLGEPVDHQA